MNGETIAMIKALQVKSIEELKTSGGISDAGKVLTVGGDGKITPTNLPVGEGQIAVDGTLKIPGAAADAKKTGDAIASLNGSLSSVEDAFDKVIVDITPDTETTGKYINTSGEEAESASANYRTLVIDSNLVGVELLISGSKWFSVHPYIFVGTTIVYPSLPSENSPKQYTDLQFTPTETGVLYINRYEANTNVHVSSVKKEELGNCIKSSYIPVDGIANSMTDALSYTVVDVGELITSKLLNGRTGEITDGTNAIQRVSDYIPVNADTYYLITTEANYSRGLYAWYTSDKIFIEGRYANAGSTYTNLFGERIKSPKNAAFIVIGYIYQNPYPFPVLMKGNRVPIYPSQKWQGKKWTIIGDSLSASYTPTGVHYFELIAGVTGIECINLGVSGTGYAKGSRTFRVQAQNVQANSDIVTIFGSGNDISSGLPMGTASDTGVESIAGCINTTLDTVFGINPVMTLGVITPTPWKQNMPYNDGNMETYANLITEICKRRSIPCLDLYHCYGLDTNNDAVITTAYSRDNGLATHPNEIGQKIIACRIKAFLETLIF